MINQYLLVWGGKGKLSTSDLCMETVICGIALLGPSWIIDNSIAGGARWQQAFGKVVFELTLMGMTRIHLWGFSVRMCAGGLEFPTTLFRRMGIKRS